MWKSCLSFLFLSRSPCSQLYLLEMKSINVAVSGQKKRKAKRRCNCTRLAIIREVSSSRKVLGTWRKELFLVRLAWPHNAPITSQHCAQDKKCGMEDELGEGGCWLIYRAGRSSSTCHVSHIQQKLVFVDVAWQENISDTKPPSVSATKSVYFSVWEALSRAKQHSFPFIGFKSNMFTLSLKKYY